MLAALLRSCHLHSSVVEKRPNDKASLDYFGKLILGLRQASIHPKN